MNLVVLRHKIRWLAVAYMRAAEVDGRHVRARAGARQMPEEEYEGHGRRAAAASRQASRLFSAHKRLVRVIGRLERGAR